MKLGLPLKSNPFPKSNKQSGKNDHSVKAKIGNNQRVITLGLATFTVVGSLWIFVISDFLVQGVGITAKDYAAEEVRNKELAKQLESSTDLSKLVDENAAQYVNDAEEEEEVADTTQVEVPVLLDLSEEELEGEEF